MPVRIRSHTPLDKVAKPGVRLPPRPWIGPPAFPSGNGTGRGGVPSRRRPGCCVDLRIIRSGQSDPAPSAWLRSRVDTVMTCSRAGFAALRSNPGVVQRFAAFPSRAASAMTQAQLRRVRRGRRETNKAPIPFVNLPRGGALSPRIHHFSGATDSEAKRSRPCVARSIVQCTDDCISLRFISLSVAPALFSQSFNSEKELLPCSSIAFVSMSVACGSATVTSTACSALHHEAASTRASWCRAKHGGAPCRRRGLESLRGLFCYLCWN